MLNFDSLNIVRVITIDPAGWVYALLFLLFILRFTLFFNILVNRNHQALIIHRHWFEAPKRLAIPAGMLGTLLALASSLDPNNLEVMLSGLRLMFTTTALGVMVAMICVLLDSVELSLYKLTMREEAEHV